mmetsp:Transcript_23494/g.60045  ORF Transcript_23494/g.60045 Transcript_23494/m.60045 type:complete len:202 (-) Transcript_23494:341-946(-)
MLQHTVGWPEGVVIHDDSTDVKQLHGKLVHLRVALALADVAEDHIDTTGLSILQHLLHHLLRRRLPHLHLPLAACLEPPIAGMPSIFDVRLAAYDTCVIGGGECHRNRRVAGERPKVEHFARIHRRRDRRKHATLLLWETADSLGHRELGDEPIAQVSQHRRFLGAKRQRQVARRERLEQRAQQRQFLARARDAGRLRLWE